MPWPDLNPLDPPLYPSRMQSVYGRSVCIGERLRREVSAFDGDSQMPPRVDVEIWTNRS